MGTIRKTWKIEGVLTDVTSAVLCDPTGTFGVKCIETGAIILAANTPMDHVGTGVYEKTFDEPVLGLTYTYYTKVVWNGQTYGPTERTFVGSPALAGHIVTDIEVLAELGMVTPTAAQTLIIANAIIKAEGAVREYLRYDPVLAERTEYHPQQPFQSQISRGIWEVMEQRAVIRQVSEAATNELQLQHLPIREVIMYAWRDYDGRSGSLPSKFPVSSLLDMGVGYWPNYDCVDAAGLKVCRDGVLRTIGLWPTTPGTVKIKYTAGYTSGELRGSDRTLNASPIWTATLAEAVRHARRTFVTQKGRVGVPAGIMSSESLGDYSYSLDGSAVKALMSGSLMPESRDQLSAFCNMGFSVGS